MIATSSPEVQEPPAPPDEPVLIAGARAGDMAAPKAVYERHVSRDYRYVYSRVGNRPDSEDLTSRTFLSVIEALPRFRERGLFEAWLSSIARRKAIEHFRRHATSVDVENAEIPSPSSDAARLIAGKQDRVELADRVLSSTDAEQELLRLRFSAEMSFSETGGLVGRYAGATKKAAYRLLARLRDQMEDPNV